MEEEVRERIKKIMAGMQCPKNFKCGEKGFMHLCRAKDFGIDNYLDCLDEDVEECSFRLSFGNGYLCQCPLRIYIAKTLKI